MICKSCRDWPLTGGENFCPNCGACLLGVQLALGADGRFPDLRLEDPARVETNDLLLAFASGSADNTELEEGTSASLGFADFAGEANYPLLEYDAERDQGLVLSVCGALETEDGRLIRTPPIATLAVSSAPPILTLQTPILQADCVMPTDARASRRGARIRFRVLNGRGVASIGRAALRLDRRPLLGDPPPYPTPVVILSGEVGLLEAWVSDEDARYLARLAGEARGSIELWDSSREERLKPLAVRLVRHGELDADLSVRPLLKVLAERPMRAPWRIRNSGGQSLRIVGAQLTLAALDGPAVVLDAEVARAVGEDDAPLEPGQTREGEIHLTLSMVESVERREASLAFDVEGVAGSKKRLVQSFELEVRPRGHQFVGRLCVDFGTTESAVAAVHGRPVAMTDPTITPPDMIDLGRASVDGPGAGDRFFPTCAALLSDGGMLFGRDAQNADPRLVVERYDDFKWLLRQPERFAVAVRYLERLRRTLEEHPDVAAEIGPHTTLFATCPTRFAPKMRSLLAEALQGAGFPDPRTRVFDPGSHGAQVLIAESWSPLPYALFDDAARFRALGVDAAGPRPVLNLKVGETGHAIVIDVGGGSADISTLRISRDPHEYSIGEVYPDTNRSFVGVKFSSQIEASFQSWSRQSGLSFKYDRALLIRHLQFADGVFSGAAMSDFLTEHFDRRLAGVQTLPDEAVLRAALNPTPGNSDRAERLNQHFERMSPLYLSEDKAIELSKDQLIDLCSRILADFLTGHLNVLTGIVDAAVGRISGATGQRILIPSGRGAAYPLARLLIVQAWRRFAPGAPVSILDPLEAKSITSWGGLYLADLAASGANFRISLGEDFRVLFAAHRELVDNRVVYKSLDWVQDPLPGERAAAARLSELPPTPIRRETLDLAFGDPKGDELDQDSLNSWPIPAEALADRSAYWVVARINGDGALARFPAWVQARDAAEAYRKAVESQE